MFAAPLAIAVLSTVGLISALVGDESGLLFVADPGDPGFAAILRLAMLAGLKERLKGR